MPQIIGKFGRNAHSDELREMLGLAPKAKLPPEGMPSRFIQGIEVWVEPMKPRPFGKFYKRSTHRTLAKCRCGKVLSAGRLHQHLEACPA